MKLLWLPSWYPSKIDPLAGDFIQRHALAVASYQPLQIIFVVKDEKARSRIHLEQSITGNLHETIAYFRPFRTGLRPLDRVISFLHYRSVSRQLVAKYIKQNGKPALVHVHVALWAGTTALWLKRKYGIPYLLTEHWTGYDKTAQDNVYTRDFVFRRSTRQVLQNASMLLAVSNQLGKLIAASFADISYQAVPNVVDTRLFKFIPAPAKSLYRFIHVSAMNFQKNPEGILRAFGQLLLYTTNVELVMAGPADPSLMLLAEQLKIQEHIRWTGAIAYSDVALEVQHASCMVMFSRYENLPCAILEALCCGLPVIATVTGGVPEIINKDNGLLVQPENERELLQAMLSMIEKNSSYDRSLIAKKATARFSYSVVGKQIEDLYQNVST
jgi:glycosyltransferase involved in cell wall biosynthesis